MGHLINLTMRIMLSNFPKDRVSVYILLVGLLVYSSIFYSCNDSNSGNNWTEEKIVNELDFTNRDKKSNVEAVADTSIISDYNNPIDTWVIPSMDSFKFQNLDTIVYYGGDLGLVHLDSGDINRYVRGYESDAFISLFSIQNSIYEFNLFTVINYYGVCDSRVTLIVSQRETGKFISAFDLSENGGCEQPHLSYSVFTSDSTFFKVTYPDISEDIQNEEGCDTILRFKKKIENYLITHEGEFKNLSVQTSWVSTYRDDIYR